MSWRVVFSLVSMEDFMVWMEASIRTLLLPSPLVSLDEPVEPLDEARMVTEKRLLLSA